MSLYVDHRAGCDCEVCDSLKDAERDKQEREYAEKIKKQYEEETERRKSEDPCDE